MLLAACGAPNNHAESSSNPAAAVLGFPTIPGATWDGDITTQEGDGQRIWVVSWTAPSPEFGVRRFFVRTLDQFGWRPGVRPLVYVCGPTAFVENVADALVALGHAPDRIRTEPPTEPAKCAHEKPPNPGIG